MRNRRDVARLDEAGIAASALADRALALPIAPHNAVFFAGNDARGERIDYKLAVSGGSQLVPPGPACSVLADKHAGMVAGDMLLDDGESFDMPMKRCAPIGNRANEAKA